jgi:hypothetical protein
MTIPTVKIVNAETGEEIIRDMNTEEIAQFEAAVKRNAERKELAEKAETDKAALLAKLGITADEAKLLLS